MSDAEQHENSGTGGAPDSRERSGGADAGTVGAIMSSSLASTTATAAASQGAAKAAGGGGESGAGNARVDDGGAQAQGSGASESGSTASAASGPATVAQGGGMARGAAGGLGGGGTGTGTGGIAGREPSRETGARAEARGEAAAGAGHDGGGAGGSGGSGGSGGEGSGGSAAASSSSGGESGSASGDAGSADSGGGSGETGGNGSSSSASSAATDAANAATGAPGSDGTTGSGSGGGGSGSDTFHIGDPGASTGPTGAAATGPDTAPASTHATDGFVAPVCFRPGTLIATPGGATAIERLRPGDLVLTSEGRAEPVRWIGRQTVDARAGDPLRVLPIRIRAGAIAPGIPARDLFLSPDHAVALDDILVHAGALVDGIAVERQRDAPDRLDYLHVELARHCLILAEGLPAETFVDNPERLAFDNWAEREAVLSGTAPVREMDRPRAKSARQVPQAIRRRLQARAVLLDQEARDLAA